MSQSAVLALASLAALPSALAEPCPPRTELAGEPAAVAEVTGELQRLGVVVGPARPDCPTISAHVENAGAGGFSVAVRGSVAHGEARVVSDATLAAIWIDSWVHDDLALDVHSMSAAIRSPQPVRDGNAAPPSAGWLERVAVSAGYEQAWTRDGAAWSGGTAAGCVRIGAACLGARGRFSSLRGGVVAVQTPAGGGASDPIGNPAMRRESVLLATASVPLSIGRIQLAPELGLGGGWMRTTRDSSCPAPEPSPLSCDPSQPDCAVPPPPPPCLSPSGVPVVGLDDSLSSSTFALRVSAAARITIPLFSRVWLDGTAAVSLSPRGHSQPYEILAGTPLAATVAGDPSTALQLGIGLRIGAP